MKVLGIESSCDETSAAIVCDSKCPSERILSNIIYSQIDIHKKYGGVVPEYAARNHMMTIDKCIEQALEKANISINEIDYIAATVCPGLIGGLLVGACTAKTISVMTNKPFMAINHLEGHLLTARLCYDNPFPHLLVLASGGHFIFAEILDIGNYKILGQTLDDAAGETLDKIAKLLNLPYPGGPEIEKLALNGNCTKFKFPLPLQKRAGCDVSFSGLKTAARNLISDNMTSQDKSCQDKSDLAASFQEAIVNFIAQQTSKALNMCTEQPQSIVLAGGVAANKVLRSRLQNLSIKNNIEFFTPPIKLCADNAAMIAWAAIERIKAGFLPSAITSPTNPSCLL